MRGVTKDVTDKKLMEDSRNWRTQNCRTRGLIHDEVFDLNLKNDDQTLVPEKNDALVSYNAS